MSYESHRVTPSNTLVSHRVVTPGLLLEAGVTHDSSVSVSVAVRDIDSRSPTRARIRASPARTACGKIGWPSGPTIGLAIDCPLAMYSHTGLLWR